MIMMNIPTKSISEIELFSLSGEECGEKLKSVLKSVTYPPGSDIGINGIFFWSEFYDMTDLFSAFW